ncbi:efflux RND transporter periplasmic adaptor subunit [Sulfuricystis multivorans]|uniref:efflux RND transporter periplasmic adaptor subunit n=1 Tax=Sulfuricystis multivorans TaxID=2211108 RepID=UPI0024DF7F6D|nr:efflux RND transporter periplasmic adaptor subunit [Sulfuricystis multivorans]
MPRLSEAAEANTAQRGDAPAQQLIQRFLKKIPSIFLLLILAACGQGNDGGKPGATAGPGKPAAMPPPEVDVVTVKPVTAKITQDLPGRLLAYRTAQVRARVEGVVEKQLFVEGSDVKAGTPLFRIDARTYRAQLDAAEADLAAARAVLARYQPLLEIKAVSQQEFDAAAAKVKQAEASLAKARLDFENAVPSAPISGRIGRALVTEGALVGRNEATHLATIEQIDPIRVEFTHGYADLLRLQQAVKAGKQKKADSAEVQLVLEDGSLYAEKGRVKFTDMAVDPSTGAVVLRAEFPNPRRELLPGAFVRVRFPEAMIDEALTVPQRAVQGSPTGQIVMTVDAEGKVSVRPIKTGGVSGNDFIVTEGLVAGDIVIVNGLQKARPGSVVKAVPWTPGAPLLAGPPAPASAAGKK